MGILRPRAGCCGTRGFRQHLLWIEFQKNVNIEGSKLNHVIEALWIFLRCLTQFSPYIRFPTLSPERFSLEKMGNPSWLRHVPASSATVPIDWSKVPEASKKFLLEGWGTDWETEKKRPLPATIGEFAKMLDKSKFFGYMEQERCTLVLDISEFGLAKPDTIPGPSQGFPVGPHFYMRYGDQVWFVLFVPGKRDAILGLSPQIPYSYGEYDEDEEIARDKQMVEDYEPKLCKEISRWGTLGAVSREKVAGWESMTVKSSLETAQMYEAVMTLPSDHPAHRAMMDGFMASLRY